MFERKKERMFDSRDVRTTSKDSLKRSLMNIYKDDVESMQKMYEFYMQDMSGLPDFDPVPPSMFDQAKSTVSSLWGWADQNQDKIIGAYNLFQSMRGGAPIPLPGPSAALEGIPPIPTK